MSRQSVFQVEVVFTDRTRAAARPDGTPQAAFLIGARDRSFVSVQADNDRDAVLIAFAMVSGRRMADDGMILSARVVDAVL